MAGPPITVEAALDNIVQGDYVTTPFAGRKWNWIGGTSSSTYTQTVKFWNDKAKQVKQYVTESPSIKTVAVASTPGSPLFPILNPLGKDYIAPQSLDIEKLVSALKDAKKEQFTSFKKELKAHKIAAKIYWEKQLEGPPAFPSPKCGTATVSNKQVCHVYPKTWPGPSETHTKNMATLLDGLDALWEFFAQAKWEERKDDGLEEDGVIRNDDFLIITELDQEITNYDLDNYTIFIRPEASDIQRLTGRYNPPAHLNTRTFAPTAYNFEGEPLILSDAELDTAANRGTFEGSFGMYNPATKESQNNQLGFIYQDIYNLNEIYVDSDSTTKKKNKKYRMGTSKRVRELWGFQFMYNPTAITYTNSTNFNVDATAMGGGEGMDPSPMFAGNTQNVSFTLLINRIIDMSALRGIAKEAGITIRANDETGTPDYLGILAESTWSKGYPRPITKEDIFGILSRGTEYDLEYLYRVVNGNPKPTPTFKNGFLTADYGTLMGSTCWVRFHDNLRYKGVITGISVNHMILNYNMIPMLTEVSISFARIPIFAWDSELEKSYYDTWKENNQDSDKDDA